MVAADVHRTRLALLDRGPQDAAAWRRLTVTERTRADVARLAGEATESVRLATALLADRRARLSDPAHADTAEAQIILGQTLLAAGHPAVARRHLEEAADTRRSRFLLTSYRVQEDLIWLAKAALVLGNTQRAAQCFRSVTGLAGRRGRSLSPGDPHRPLRRGRAAHRRRRHQAGGQAAGAGAGPDPARARAARPR
jgi:hypothetical protein